MSPRRDLELSRSYHLEESRLTRSIRSHQTILPSVYHLLKKSNTWVKCRGESHVTLYTRSRKSISYFTPTEAFQHKHLPPQVIPQEYSINLLFASLSLQNPRVPKPLKPYLTCKEESLKRVLSCAEILNASMVMSREFAHCWSAAFTAVWEQPNCAPSLCASSSLCSSAAALRLAYS